MRRHEYSEKDKRAKIIVFLKEEGFNPEDGDVDEYQIEELIQHIDTHDYFLREKYRDIPFDWGASFFSWYTNVYQPLVRELARPVIHWFFHRKNTIYTIGSPFRLYFTASHTWWDMSTKDPTATIWPKEVVRRIVLETPIRSRWDAFISTAVAGLFL